MNFWNPNNKAVLYFHVVRRDDDFYIRANTAKQEAYLIIVVETPRQSAYIKKGIYKIRWNTFITGYVCDLNLKTRLHKKQCESYDGVPRTWVKYTTANQWNKAFEKLITEIKND